MSVYNTEKYLEEAIKSILNQTFEDFEFIIIDDMSNDTSPKILKKFSEKDDRIRVIYNKERIGLARTLNNGIKEADGKYIARMDADDVSHPERFQKQIEFLEQNEDIYILGTWAHWINENGEIIKEARFPITINGTDLYKTGAALHPSIMIRKKLFDEKGLLYNAAYDIGLEFELYMRTLKNGFKIGNIPEYLLFYRINKEGMTSTHLKKTQLNQFKIKMTYLPYFLNFRNTMYTLRSLAGYILPAPLLRKMVLR